MNSTSHSAAPVKLHVATAAIPLRRADIDSAAHVNNTNYFRFMEEARMVWYESHGIEGDFGDPHAPGRKPSVLPPGCGPIIVTASCSFSKALKFPGDAIIDVYISEPGRSSIVISYVFRASYAPETVFAEGSTKAVWINNKEEKSIPLPEVVRALFNRA